MEVKIKSTGSVLPDGIAKAVLLEIEETSMAQDVFHILTNYPKIKKVRIGGVEYKREQVGKLGLQDRIGADTSRGNILEGITWRLPEPAPRPPDRVWDANTRRWVPRVTPQQATLTRPAPVRGAWEQLNDVGRIQAAPNQAPLNMEELHRTVYDLARQREAARRAAVADPYGGDVYYTEEYARQVRGDAGNVANAQVAQPTPAQLANLFEASPLQDQSPEWELIWDEPTPVPTPTVRDNNMFESYTNNPDRPINQSQEETLF